MRITTAGNVGIGTASPGTKFHVDGGAASTYMRVSNTGSTNGLYVGVDGSGESLLSAVDAKPLKFATTNIERMRIDSSGNVGIGTASPLSQLDVYSTIVSPTLGEATGVGTIRITNGASALSSAGGLEFKNAGDSNGYGAKIQSLNSGGAQLVFANRNGTGTWSERMRIDSSGNVGIGTNSPGAKLDVSGTSRVRTDVSTSTVINTITNAAANAYATHRTDANDYQFYTTGSSKMVIDTSGNVGIGTASPGAKLDVNGSIASGTAAYVYSYAGGGSGSVRSGIYMDGTNQVLQLLTGTAERVRIDSSGNLLIGNTSAATVGGSSIQVGSRAGFYQLTVNNAAYFSNNMFYDGTNWRMKVAAAGGIMQCNTDGSFNWTVGSSVSAGAITALTATLVLDASGNLTATGNVTAYSDARLKKNVSTIDNALALVEKMRGVRYERIEDGKAGVGVIAQEMQEVVPEVVHEGENLSVAYGNLVGVLIEAVKELSARVKELEAK